MAEMTQTAMIVGWAIAFVFFAACELATSTALVSIWFGFGALISMILAIFDCSFMVQCIVFVLTSVVLLILTRPLAKKIQGKHIKTNYELDIGKKAVVIEDIDNDLSHGRVKLKGVNWEARSVNDEKISVGSVVTVEEIDGTKLIVSK